jgi:hypothetical protein
MHKELLGASLPNSTAGWCFVFLVVLVTLAGALTAIEQFFKLFAGRNPGFRPLGGLALPLGWVVWSVALLYWKAGTATGLSVLLGLLVIITALTILIRNQK